MAVAPGPVLSKEQWEKMRKEREFKQVVPKKSGSDWTGLVFKPENLSFSTQNEDEEVFILLRRHFITNIGWIWNTAFYAVLPIIANSVATLLQIDVLKLVGWKLLTITGVIFYSILFTNAVRHFVDWYFNLYIVTSERVIDYDFKSFVSKGVAESNLAAIQDVKEISIGFLPSLLNYGDVSMYSAADKNVIIFDDIPNPTLVRDKVADLAKIAKYRTYE